MSTVIKFPRHKLHQCGPGCDGCMFCEGGLALCVTCGGEASLPTHCPGERMDPLIAACVQDGSVDYRERNGGAQQQPFGGSLSNKLVVGFETHGATKLCGQRHNTSAGKGDGCFHLWGLLQKFRISANRSSGISHDPQGFQTGQTLARASAEALH